MTIGKIYDEDDDVGNGRYPRAVVLAAVDINDDDDGDGVGVGDDDDDDRDDDDAWNRGRQ